MPKKCVCPPQTKDTHTPEVSLSVETRNMNHPITSQANQAASSDPSQPPPPNTSTNQALQPAPASLMKSAPDVTESDTREGRSDSASGQMTSTASMSERDTPLDLTLQGWHVESHSEKTHWTS